MCIVYQIPGTRMTPILIGGIFGLLFGGVLFSLKIEDDSRFQVSTTAFEKQIWPMRMSFPNRSRNNSRPKNITCRSNGPPFRCWNLWMLPFLVIPLMKAVGFSEVKSHEKTGSLRRKRHLGPVVVVRGWWVAQIGPFGCPSFKPSNSFSNDNQNDWTKESFGQRSRIKMPKKKRSGPGFFFSTFKTIHVIFLPIKNRKMNLRIQPPDPCVGEPNETWPLQEPSDPLRGSTVSETTDFFRFPRSIPPSDPSLLDSWSWLSKRNKFLRRLVVCSVIWRYIP